MSGVGWKLSVKHYQVRFYKVLRCESVDCSNDENGSHSNISLLLHSSYCVLGDILCTLQALAC